MSEPYKPHPLLRSGHVQTMLGSTGRRWLLPRREQAFLAQQETLDITVLDDVVLRVQLNRQDEPAPLVVFIHGWLGCDYSSYVLSAAAHAYRQGFNIARINLRDHGGTEALNEGMYHSARTAEIVALAEHLRATYGQLGAAVVGFSLGGNFALRVGQATGMPTLAICPALDPERTMWQIDNGASVYRTYFLRKWWHNLEAKQHAFPHLYDFTKALSLNTVATMTDHFVREHSEFKTTDEYFELYHLSPTWLEGVQATILAAVDDPVIPASQFDNLPDSIDLQMMARGGHGAFVEDLRLNSWADGYISRWANTQLGEASAEEPHAPTESAA